MANNPEYQKQYRAKNRAKLSAQNKVYRQKNRKRLKAYLRQYYLKHKEQIITRSALWGKKNPEKKYAHIKSWEKRNPEKVAARQARWVAKNLPKCAIKSKKRRELLSRVEQTDAASSTVLAQLISSCARMQCAICGKNMPKNDRTYDHVIPLAKGGTGHIANLQVVHLSCNCSKRCKTPDQLSGQFEMNFAGNRAHLNNSDYGSRQAQESTITAVP